MSRAIRFRVTGRVQGVGFRAHTRRAAREAGVRGWVANAPDGSVVGAAEGEEPALRALVAALRRGPAPDLVVEVEIDNVEPKGWTAFDIRR